MKIYIASSFNLIQRVKCVVEMLERAGHTITMKWWDRAFNVSSEGLVHTIELKRRYENMPSDEFYTRPECKIAHDTDKQAVKDADVLLLVADTELKLYTGASVEIGMADAWDKPRLYLGKITNSAMYFGMKHCESIDEVLYTLEAIDILM